MTTFTDQLLARAQADEGWEYPESRSVSTHTPWSRADYAYTYGRGVVSYSTPGHGGFRLSPTRNTQVHEALRNADGWYEEDVEWAAAAVTFPELFPRKHVQSAVRSLRSWNPDGWTAFSGEEVAVEESHVLRKRQFERDNADRWVVLSARGRSDGSGLVDVTATLGGSRQPGVEHRDFVVTKSDYDQRGEFGYVVQPATLTS